MKCPQCKTKMENVQYDVEFGIVINSLTCPDCRHNFTKEVEIDKIIKKLQEKKCRSKNYTYRKWYLKIR